jgi:phosphoglycerate kinase
MKFPKKTIRDVPLQGKTVLLRADYNVPLTKTGKIGDDLRIKASLPTIKYLIEQNCKVVIISHLGRPDGKKNAKYSLEPVADRLSRLLKQDVNFVDTTIGDKPYQAIKRATPGSVTVLENLRFYPEEEANDEKFAAKIVKATGARYLVQDGFGVVHRSHASTDAIALCVPAVAGLLLEKEYSILMSAIKKPKRPLVAILGGAKVTDKIGVIERFVDIADKILIGGAMANTFLAYKGFSVGKSMHETNQNKVLDKIYQKAQKKVDKGSVENFIILPKDLAVGYTTDSKEERRVVSVGKIGDEDMGLDVGDLSIERYVKIIEKAGTVVWNGTLGYAEQPEFSHASARIALALATNSDIDSIIGGGDTADFALKWSGGDESLFSHISTGGGASLELLAGKKLPGIEVLLDAR